MTARRSEKNDKNDKSDRKVEKVAWFMANFQCVDLDESSFERIRELLSHCRGSKTRVALSSTDGWKSGKNSLLHKHKKKKVPLSCIHNLIQDEKFINVLLCVFAVQVANSDDPKLEVVAFKFRCPEDAHDIVTRFQEWTNTVPLEGSVNGSVLMSRSTATPMPGRPTNGRLTPHQWNAANTQRRAMSTSAGELSADEVLYARQVQHYSSRSSAEPRQPMSNDRSRMFSSEDGSLVFSDAETDGVAIAHVRIYNILVCVLGTSRARRKSQSKSAKVAADFFLKIAKFTATSRHQFTQFTITFVYVNVCIQWRI